MSTSNVGADFKKMDSFVSKGNTGPIMSKLTIKINPKGIPSVVARSFKAPPPIETKKERLKIRSMKRGISK